MHEGGLVNYVKDWTRNSGVGAMRMNVRLHTSRERQ